MVTKTTHNSNEFVLPHAKIPHADMDWVLQQSPTVLKLWVESWRADSFGTATSKIKTQWHTLKTKLQGSNLRAAIRSLELAGLFKYEPTYQKTEKGQRKIVSWKCTNLHGYYSGHWKLDDDISKLTDSTGKLNSENVELDTDTDKLDDVSGDLQPESESEQESENNQLLSNNSSTTLLLPTKVVEEELIVDQVATTQPHTALYAPSHGASAAPLGVAAMAASSEKEGQEEEWDKKAAIKEVLDMCALCGYFPNSDARAELETFVEIQFPPVFKWLEKLKTCSASERSKWFNHALRMGRIELKSKVTTN